MASSDSDVSSEAPPPSLEEMTITGAISMILNFAAASPPSRRQRDVTVVVDARTNSVAFIEGAADAKVGHLPASKASIDAMPVVKVGEEGIECSICLAEFELGGDAKAMPCNHGYHPGCIDKWLRIHGSCPICRYEMPAEDGEVVRKEGDQLGEVENETRRDGGTERQEGAAMVFHIFFRTGGRSNSDSDSEMQGDTNQENFGSEDSEVAMEIDGR